MLAYYRDSDGCLLRGENWATDVWVPSAGEWRSWPTDWSAARLNEIPRPEAQAIAGAGADLDQPAAV